MQSVIGALRVNLGLDAARFSEGLKNASSALGKWGQNAQKVGQTLSARLTAPIAAAGVAAAASVSAMANNLSALSNQAKIAGAGTAEFQKLAYAARTVGVEQDKLSDILKDVNDKVGDFLSTGGGEMAAFFENVAPKIGLTADAFRDLSGPQALQLYVSSLEKAGLSHAEMTFYMEAIADEASALIPILANNGQEYSRLAANAEKFGLASDGNIRSAIAANQAFADMRAALRGVIYALMDSGLLDAVTGITESVTKWAVALRGVNPDVVWFGVAIAGVAAALGPVLVSLGLLSAAIGAISAPVVAAVAAIGALAAAAVALYANWEQIRQQFPAIAGVVENLGAAFGAMATGTLERFRLMVQGIEQLLQGNLSAAMQTCLQILTSLGQNIALTLGAALGFSQTEVQTFVSETVGAISELSTRLSAEFAAAKAGFDAFVADVRGGFANLLEALRAVPGQMAAIGRDIMSGLLSGLQEKWESVKAWFSNLGTSIPQWVRDQLGIRSPSTVFAEIGANVMQGLQGGLGAQMGTVEEELSSFGQGLGATFAQFLTEGGSFRDSMRGLLADSLGSWGSKMLSGAFGSLGEAIKLPGHANGTRFASGGLAWVGERGPELIEPPRGSRVYPHQASMKMMRSVQEQRVVVEVSNEGGIRAYVKGQLAQAAPKIAENTIGAMRKGNKASRHFLGP